MRFALVVSSVAAVSSFCSASSSPPSASSSASPPLRPQEGEDNDSSVFRLSFPKAGELCWDADWLLNRGCFGSGGDIDASTDADGSMMSRTGSLASGVWGSDESSFCGENSPLRRFSRVWSDDSVTGASWRQEMTPPPPLLDSLPPLESMAELDEGSSVNVKEENVNVKEENVVREEGKKGKMSLLSAEVRARVKGACAQVQRGVFQFRDWVNDLTYRERRYYGCIPYTVVSEALWALVSQLPADLLDNQGWGAVHDFKVCAVLCGGAYLASYHREMDRIAQMTSLCFFTEAACYYTFPVPTVTPAS